MKKIILSTLTILMFLYCLRLGYIWTAYAHGGQLAGIPFALLALFLTFLFFLTKNLNRKENIYFVTLSYFISIAGFSLSIEIIRKVKYEYFAFLYHEGTGWVNEILLAWLVLGLVIFILLKYISKRSAINRV